MKITDVINALVLSLKQEYKKINTINFEVFTVNQVSHLTAFETDPLRKRLAHFTGKSKLGKTKWVEVRTMNSKSGAMLYLVVSGSSPGFVINKILLSLSNAGLVKTQEIFTNEEIEKRYGIFRLNKEKKLKTTKI